MSSPSPQSRPGSSRQAPTRAPGELIDGRFRVVALLGRGAMGEVWRVEDLELGQQVALKFLPRELAQDPDARQRFLDEVRVARRVSHPNVCRVHDVGGDAQAPYLTMEYIDGEDLGSLLRRIGRLPEDKAVELARQICAGLAAAHAQGVVHRDLKPANILVDGAGVARIADFGLSALAAEMRAEDAGVGTPRYMAPEQLRGQAASPRSDIFALGLVLFELFTGREAFRAQTLAELIEAHASSRPDARAIVEHLDPTIDALLRRCLASDPQRRPASALEVSAALPGGDPLAAALAAGETPSPELVAASGGVGALRLPLALALLAATAVLLAFAGWADERIKLVSLVDPQLPAAVLDQRALDIARAAGVAPSDSPPESRVSAFVELILDEAQRPEAPRGERWELLREPWSQALRFWWRASDEPLRPWSNGGIVTWNDPPPTRPGDVRIVLAHDGRLLGFSASPRAEDAAAAQQSPGASCDWAPLFAAAKIDPSLLEAQPANFRAPFDNDSKQAFEGPAPGLEGVRLQVQLASLGARPVFFNVDPIWSMEGAPASAKSTWRNLLFEVVEELLIALALIGGIGSAVVNLRRGDGDLRGGVRVAVVSIVLAAAAWALRAHHAGGWLSGLFKAAPDWLFRGSVAGFIYVALEPTVRRTSPRLLVAWQRLLAGRVSDSTVARDVLIGLVAGLGVHALMLGNWLAVDALGDPAARPHFCSDATFASTGYQIGAIALALIAGSTFALLVPFLYVLALKLGRRPLVAYGLLMLIGLARMPYSVTSATPAVDLGFRVAQFALILFSFHRGGLVALLGCFTALHVVPDLVGAASAQAWYADAWRLGAGCLLALAAWAAWRATRPTRARGFTTA